MCSHIAEALVISDPDFQQEDPNFLSRSDRYDAAVRKSAQMILKLREYGISDPEEIYNYKRYRGTRELCSNVNIFYQFHHVDVSSFLFT